MSCKIKEMVGRHKGMGGLEEKRKLVELFHPIVIRIAIKVQEQLPTSPSFDRKDLVAEGVLGFLIALDEIELNKVRDCFVYFVDKVFSAIKKYAMANMPEHIVLGMKRVSSDSNFMDEMERFFLDAQEGTSMESILTAMDLEAALRELDNDAREILILAHIGNLTPTQIGERKGLERTEVGKRLASMRRVLQQALKH